MTDKSMYRYQDQISPYYPSYVQHDERADTHGKYFGNYHNRSQSTERQYNRTPQRFNNHPSKTSYQRRTRKYKPYTNYWRPSQKYSAPYKNRNNRRYHYLDFPRTNPFRSNRAYTNAIEPRFAKLSFKATNSYGIVGTYGQAISNDHKLKLNYNKIMKHLVISHILTQLIPANSITEQHFGNTGLNSEEDEKFKNDSKSPLTVEKNDENVDYANKIIDDHDDGYDADSEEGCEHYFFENLYYSSKLRKEIKKYHAIKKELMEITAEIQMREKKAKTENNNKHGENIIYSKNNASTVNEQS